MKYYKYNTIARLPELGCHSRRDKTSQEVTVKNAGKWVCSVDGYFWIIWCEPLDLRPN